MANKTQPSDNDPVSFLTSIEHETRRQDAGTLLELMGRVTGLEPKMWGATLVGFGRYHYVYESGREGDWFMVGFSPRKANLVIYLMPGDLAFAEQLPRLGKHKIGKSCLYINKLADVDLSVLEEMVQVAVDGLHEKYETFPS